MVVLSKFFNHLGEGCCSWRSASLAVTSGHAGKAELFVYKAFEATEDVRPVTWSITVTLEVLFGLYLSRCIASDCAMLSQQGS